MKKEFTHQGKLVGVDKRTDPKWSLIAKLRETRKFWVSEYGNKYYKVDGWKVGETFPLNKLDINSIKPINISCSHNIMVATGDKRFAWKCAKCGYVYGKK